MKANFSLSIPKPCSEDWNSFTPTSTGGFCGSCQKNVTDFTKATDEEIIAFISKKSNHACGRLRGDQLKAYIILPEVKIRPGFMLLKAGVIGLLFLLISKPASAQPAAIPSKTEIVQKQQPVVTSPVKKEFVIRGVVTSLEDSVALPGISVFQRGTDNLTYTDGYGRFSLQVDLSKGNILAFTFIGLKIEEYKFTADTRDISIVMESDNAILGEMIIMGSVSVGDLYSEDQHLFRRVWTKIKNWF